MNGQRLDTRNEMGLIVTLDTLVILNGNSICKGDLPKYRK
jgi:hypothetical protein